MSVKAIFTDMDGTLLNRSHVVSAFTQGVLRRLKQRHPAVRFVLITGRPYPDVLETVRRLGLAADLVITSNGAVMHAPAAATAGSSAPPSAAEAPVRYEKLVQHDMDPAAVAQLMALTRLAEAQATANAHAGTSADAADAGNAEGAVATCVMRNDEWLTDRMVPGLGSGYGPHFQPRVLPELTTQPSSFYAGVHEVYFYGPEPRLAAVEALVSERLGGSVNHARSLRHLHDVSPAGINKGTALLEACRLLGLDAATEAVALGDGENDATMFKVVRAAYVMSNAVPSLLRAVGLEGKTPGARSGTYELIGSNDDDAVARKIIDLFPDVAGEE